MGERKEEDKEIYRETSKAASDDVNSSQVSHLVTSKELGIFGDTNWKHLDSRPAV